MPEERILNQWLGAQARLCIHVDGQYFEFSGQLLEVDSRGLLLLRTRDTTVDFEQYLFTGPGTTLARDDD